MYDQGIAELTRDETGILASAIHTKLVDDFSKPQRRVLASYQQPELRPQERIYYSDGQPFVVEWQDYGQALPAWFDPLVQGFIDLLTLPPNWDSYGAGPVDPALVQAAMKSANAFLRPSSPPPRVVPLSTNGVQLEWHRKNMDLEIVFDTDCEPFFSYRNRISGEGVESPLSDLTLLDAILKQLE